MSPLSLPRRVSLSYPVWFNKPSNYSTISFSKPGFTFPGSTKEEEHQRLFASWGRMIIRRVVGNDLGKMAAVLLPSL